MSTKPLGRSLAVALAVIAAIAIPAFTMSQDIGLSQAEFAGLGDQTLRAAPYAFSIWGVIYLGLIANGLYQLLAARESATLAALAWPSEVAILGCGVWILASAFNAQWASVAIIVTSATALIVGLDRARRDEPAPSKTDRLLIAWPMTLLAGWLTIASGLNLFTVLTAQGLIQPQLMWSVGAVSAVVLVAAAVGWRLRSMVYLVPVVWGLVGVYVAEQADKPTVAALAAGGALALALEAILLTRARRTA